MKLLSFIFSYFVGVLFANCINAQGATYAIAPGVTSHGIGGWRDPALNHNQLMQNKASEGTWKLIGPYKVAGSPYLFGEQLNGNIFSPEAKAYNIRINYNIYNQEVEFYSTSNPAAPLVKEPGELDSFVLKASTENGISKDTKFIYSKHLGSKGKQYYQEIITGNYSIYKKYSAELAISSTNYLQTELRVFHLHTEYYYTAPDGKGLKRIKPSLSAFSKEFKDVKELSSVVTQEEFTMNPEEAMCKAIRHINAN